MPNNVEVVEKITLQLNAILQTDKWSLVVNGYKDYNLSEKLDLGEYKLDLEGVGKIASFKLVPMPNCCGICVSTQANVHKDYQGKGIGTLLNSIRIDIARYLGYGCLMCTDVERNESQRRILSRNGWKDVYKFVNPRTQNTIFVSVINL